jgi:hypothetical protein
MSSRLSNFPSLSTDRGNIEDGPRNRGKKVLRGAALAEIGAESNFINFVSTADDERQNPEGGQINPLSATDVGTSNRTKSPPGDFSAAEFKKLQALAVAINDKVAQEARSIQPMAVEQPTPRSESLSLNPQNILPSESSELISTQDSQAKSLLDSSDDASVN